jgi:protein SCO1/2
MDNNAFTEQNLLGQWTIVFFGFTRCRSVCPTTMTELARFMKSLQQQHIQPLPHVVLISLDPEHDTLPQLQQFVTAFDPHFYAATGTTTAVAQLSQSLGIAYSTNPHTDIEHSGTLVFFNPKGQVIAYFTPPHQAALLADDYRLLLNQHDHKGT